MIVYGFMYNDCVHESAWRTVSLHIERSNAKKALQKHMIETFKAFKDYKKYCLKEGFDRPSFGFHEDWSIHEFTILP